MFQKNFNPMPHHTLSTQVHAHFDLEPVPTGPTLEQFVDLKEMIRYR